MVVVATTSGAEGAASQVPAVSLAGVGDIAMKPSGDAEAFFPSTVRAALRGDVVLGNLEGTLSTRGSSKCTADSANCYAFRAPPSYARVLEQAGFTVLNLANNHALDYGREGRRQTINALRRAGLRHTGGPGEIAYLRTGSTRVAVIGFAPYPWAQSLLDIPGAQRLVRKAARHADLVVVTVHAGAEGAGREHVRPGRETFLGENRGNVVAFAHAVVAAGADVVIGHGPHVLRGLEWYHGRLIAYSLGNFLGNGTLSLSGVNGVSGILQVWLRPDGSWLRGRLVPVRLVSPGLPRTDPAARALGLIRDLSRQDFGRNAVRVARDGRLLPPAWRTG